MECGWSADQVEVVGFVDSQRFMDVAMRVDVRSHGPIQREAAGRHEAGEYEHLKKLFSQNTLSKCSSVRKESNTPI